MSKEYLNGQDLKPEKKKGFESRKNTILLSVILVLVLAFITSVVIILLKSKNKNEEAPSDSQSVVVTEQTNPHKTGGLPQAGGELPSIEITQTTPVETCPIWGSTDFNAPDGEGYKSCKKCDTKWKENGDKILVVQDGGKTETATAVITTEKSATITENSVTITQKPTSSTGPTTGTYFLYNSQGNYRIVPETLNLRAEPSLDSEIVMVLSKGDIVYVDEVKSFGWGHTVFEGQEGWLQLTYGERIFQ